MAITIDGTNGLTTDNAALKLDGTTLVVDDTNNRVGVGTASPSSALHVVGSQLRLQTNNCSHQFYNTAGSRYAYLEAASGGLVIDVESGGGSKFIVRSSGSEKIQVNQYGLCFNGDTAAANALDDYEEGTWTPTINFDGASVGVTYTTQVGTYTKVGRLVTIACYIVLSNKGSSAGTPGISGLPFTSANITNNFTTSGSIWMSNASSLSGSLTMLLPANSSNLSLRAITGTGDTFTVSNSNFGNTTSISISASYYTA